MERGAPPGRDMALSLLAVTVPQHDELACSRRWHRQGETKRRVARKVVQSRLYHRSGRRYGFLGPGETLRGPMPTPQRLLVLTRGEKAIETKSKRRVGVFCGCSFRRHDALTAKRVVGVLLISRTWGNFERTDADPQRLLVLPRGEKTPNTSIYSYLGIHFP